MTDTKILPDAENSLFDFNCKKSVKKFYVLFHRLSYFCNNPNDDYVYDETEIKSAKLQKYIKNHNFGRYKTDVSCEIGHKTEVCCFDSKKWDVEEVINLESFGWYPWHVFLTNGFKFLEEIDLLDLFGHKITEKRVDEKGKIYYAKRFRNYNNRPPCNLEEKKEAIQQILEKHDHKNRNLIICRAFKSGLTWWDVVLIFSEGNQSKTKNFHRLKIQLSCVKKKIKSHTSRILKGIATLVSGERKQLD